MPNMTLKNVLSLNQTGQKDTKGKYQVNTTHRELPMDGGYVGKCNMDTKQVK